MSHCTEILAVHRSTYERLAEQYEMRVPQRICSTRHRINRLTGLVHPAGRVLDVGCGVGLATGLLAARGFHVTAIDLSPRMTAYAKVRAPGARIVVGEFLSW